MKTCLTAYPDNNGSTKLQPIVLKVKIFRGNGAHYFLAENCGHLCLDPPPLLISIHVLFTYILVPLTDENMLSVLLILLHLSGFRLTMWIFNEVTTTWYT